MDARGHPQWTVLRTTATLSPMVFPRAALLAIALAACGGGSTATDAGEDLAGPDGGAPMDARPNDAASMDAAIRDAALLDAAPGDSGPTDFGTDMPAGPRIVLGTGRLAFEPLPADGTLELVQGTQGGNHFDVALQLFGLEAEGLGLRYRAVDAATGERLFLTLERELSAATVLVVEDHLVRSGDRLVLDEAVVSRADVAGSSVRIEATITPSDGAPLVAAATVVVVADP